MKKAFAIFKISQTGFQESVKRKIRKLIKPAPVLRSPIFTKHKNEFQKVGLEIGGPSALFSVMGYYPIYNTAERVDNVNFHESTRWQGSVKSGLNFSFNPEKDPGKQYILDAGSLTEISSDSYDFIVSSHMLEHTANPIKVLLEWKRILKVNGCF